MNETSDHSVICKVCRAVLETETLIKDGGIESITYRHIGGDKAHAPDVAIVPRKDAKLVCDFCSRDNPKSAFVPTMSYEYTYGKDNKYLRDSVDTDIPERYTDRVLPWTCCETCVPVVKLGDVEKLVEHVCKKGKTGALYQLSVPIVQRAMKEEWRNHFKEFYLFGQPEGPFPLAEV